MIMSFEGSYVSDVEDYYILSFDPPTTRNMGWACFRVRGGVAHMVESGIRVLDDEDAEAIVQVGDFVSWLLTRFSPVRAMCFERSIGAGWAPTREKLAEATGVIKFLGARIGIEIHKIHTGTMAKDLTGSGATRGKKSRLKWLAREGFFPKAKSFGEIASYEDDEGKLIEFFEHQADAICFGLHHLLTRGVIVEGTGRTFEPIEPRS